MFDYALAIRYLLLTGMIFLSVTAFLCLFFAVKNPRLTDKVVAINMIGVKVILLIVMVCFYIEEPSFVDVAIVYALLSFLATIILTRFILRFKVNKYNSREQRDAVKIK